MFTAPALWFGRLPSLRNWYPPNSARATLLAGVPVSKTLERVIEAAVRRTFGCETVALVDPVLKALPKSPRYISSDNDAWRDVIEVLLQRALVVILILSPGQTVRDALRWELRRAVELGLLGRLLFVLPPPGTEGHAAALAALRDLSDVLPALSQSEPNWIVIYPHDDRRFQWFEVTSPDVADKTYHDAISEILSGISAKVRDLSFVQRYPYFTNANVIAFHR